MTPTKHRITIAATCFAVIASLTGAAWYGVSHATQGRNLARPGTTEPVGDRDPQREANSPHAITVASASVASALGSVAPVASAQPPCTRTSTGRPWLDPPPAGEQLTHALRAPRDPNHPGIVALTFFGDGGAPREDAIVVTRGPYVQQVKGTSALVVWETDEPVGTRLVYGRTGGFERMVSCDEPKRRHVVRLEELVPGKRYSYAIELAEQEGANGVFRTEGLRSAPFRAVVFGDTRTGHRDHREVIRNLAAEGPAVALHTGDLVGMGSSPQQWDNFFAIEQPLLSSVPLYPAIGNHEEDGKLYVEAFELPEDSPHPERCYTFSYATAWFAVLDVYTSPFGEGSEQLAWIEKELETASKRPEIRHRIVMAHHGPFDSGMHGSNMEMREQLVPLFERYGVDMVFTGHNHHYERSTVNGIKYVVTGGSGAPLRDVQGDWWTEKRDSVLHYITLDMHGAWLRFEAKKLDGSELDGFELGRDVYECEADSDCAGSERGVCEDGFEPRWACARSACVPDCVYAPPSEDEGVGLTWE